MEPARRRTSSGARYRTEPNNAAAASIASQGPLARAAAWLRKLHQLKTEHQFLGRYSVDKLEAFYHYHTNAPWWRVALVLVATPIPTLLVLLAMDAVPMQDPRVGPHQQGVWAVRSVLSHGLMTAVCLLPARQALRLHDSGNYSVWKIALISALTCIGLESVFISLAFTWRFPVPFRELLGVPVWSTLVVLLHCWLAPRVFSRRPRRTRVYLVVVTVQIVILYGFLSLSMAFANVPSAAQVAMIALFPAVKIAIKRYVWTYARQLDDISSDVTICMVEISGSLYQTVCIQFANSKIIGAIILFTDLAQALFEVHAYLATEYLVDGRASLTTAMAIVQSSVFPGADERPSLAHYSSTTSFASVAESYSTSRRYSGTGVGIRRRVHKTVIGSVFLQPKTVKKRATKRLMDLRHIDVDVDLMDLASARVGADLESSPNEIDDPTTERERSIHELSPSPSPSPAPASETSPHQPTVVAEAGETPDAPNADSGLVETEGLLGPDGEVGVSRPLATPTLQPQAGVASIRTASRTVRHTDLAGAPPGGPAAMTLPPPDLPPLEPGPPRLGKPMGSAAASAPLPNPPALVLKSTASTAQTTAPSTGSVVEWALGIPRRLMVQRKLSDNSTHPEPAADTPPDSPPRRSSATSSLSRVLPAVAPTATSPPVAPPPTSSVPSTARPSSLLVFAGRTPSFDNRRRGSDAHGSCGSVGSGGGVTIDGVHVARREQARILEQTLQLLFSCEVLLFVEYMEVVMPVLYAACVGTEWALPNGKYNRITMGLDRAGVLAAVGGSVLYAALELLSLLALNYVVWRKYGVSAAHLLAFVLETYALTLQGKLVGAFIVITNTATLHQGVDFSFRFDYDALLGPMPKAT